MKRDEQLVPLSHDHHKALVIVNRINLIASKDRGDLNACWQEIRGDFAAELLAHFSIEEQCLLPLLSDVVEGRVLEGQLLSEHKHLKLLLNDAKHDAACQFAVLLKAHVRFEERELFPYLERRYTTEELEIAMGYQSKD